MDKSKETVNIDYRARLDRQMKNLEAIHEKILQMETENPSLEIIEALYVELGQISKEINDLGSKQEEFDQLLEEKQQLLLEKDNRLEQIKHYQEEKDHIIKLIKFRDYENEQLRKDRDKLYSWMGKLQKDYKKVLNSSSWKIGSSIVALVNKLRFRSKKNITLKRMSKIFDDFEDLKQKNRKIIEEESPGALDSNYKKLTEWFEQLRKNMNKLLASKRWKFTRFLGHFALGPIGRGKTPRQIKNINKIFAEYEALIMKGRIENTERLKTLIENFERNYRSLINSKRWKASNTLFTLLNKIMPRKQQKLATGKIEDTLKQFHEWKKQDQQ